MKMSLSAKGRRLPPPTLDAPLQRLSVEIQSWPGIIAATHWHFSRNGRVDGADFYRGEEELGHLHLDGELHLAAPPALTRALLGAGLAQPFPWASGDEWVLYRIRSEADARHAERLIRLSYDHLGGTSEAELVGTLPQISLERAADAPPGTGSPALA